MAEIKKLVALNDKDFWSEKKNIAAVKYYLLQAIEAIGSVCIHIAAKKFNKAADSFGECFEILENNGFLEKKLAIKLRKMARFRNKLVHFYWEISDAKILEYARNDLEDFGQFIKAIKSIL